MCGIAGLFNHDGQPADRAVLTAMTRAMHHRGPDDQGQFVDRHVALGHRRLSIIDRASGHQPLCNEDESVWIAFNGEIYNFQEIREDLLSQGHRFRTRSDTEVIVHLYEDLGEGCVQRLHGMFAFAIWDRRTETLLLARDRMGIKPLYYHAGRNTFVFASEIRALLAADGVSSTLNLQAVHDFLTHRYVTAPHTAWRGIFKLEPGHLLSLKGGSLAVKSYWDLNFSKKLAMPEDEMVDECYRRLEASTKSHLVGEVPHGVFLSGGLDSTMITGLVARMSGQRVKTFSVGFDGDADRDQDELPYARLAAAHFGTDHHELVMTPEQYADGLRDFVWSMEEPMADPSAIPLYALSRLARDSVTIMLSGEGSDELLAGYTFWQPLTGYRRAEWVRRIPSSIRRWALRPLNRAAIGSARLARYLDLADAPPSSYFQSVPARMTSYFSEEMKREIYGHALHGVALSPSDGLVRDAYRRAAPFEPLDQMLYVYSKQWLPDDLLLKADKMTMAHSLELRVPFLDHPFVEFAASLPESMKVRKNGKGYIEKYVLRRAAARLIPREIIERRKLGFAVPVWTLLDRGLRDMAWDVIRSDSFRQSGVFDERKVSDVLKQVPRGAGGNWGLLWLILVFGVWLDCFKPSVA
jgi:asparagine synthase (glutamine-hydrolysing)